MNKKSTLRKHTTAPVTVWVAEKVFDTQTTSHIGIGLTRLDAIWCCQAKAIDDEIELPTIDDFRQETTTLYEAQMGGTEWKVYAIPLNKVVNF